MALGSFIVDASSPQRCCQIKTGNRIKGDQTTLCMTISNAETACNCFQKMGLIPQIKKAAAAYSAPEEDLEGAFVDLGSFMPIRLLHNIRLEMVDKEKSLETLSH